MDIHRNTSSQMNRFIRRWKYMNTKIRYMSVYSHTWHYDSSTEAKQQRPGATRIAVASGVRRLLQANGTEKAPAPAAPPDLSIHRSPPSLAPSSVSSSPYAPLHPSAVSNLLLPLHGSAGSLGCLDRRRHVRGGGEPGARRPPPPLCQGHPEGAA